MLFLVVVLIAIAFCFQSIHGIEPTEQPSLQPTVEFTIEPTVEPSVQPISNPTFSPTVFVPPTRAPTCQPSRLPSRPPTVRPTNPTANPTIVPSRHPTVYPTNPTANPTAPPSVTSENELFAVVGGTQCAEGLRFGPQAITTMGSADGQNNFFMSTSVGLAPHQKWLQIVTNNGVNEIFRIYWSFNIARSVPDRFYYAVNFGESVSYRVVIAATGEERFLSGTWRFSTTASIPVSKLSNSAPSTCCLSADDGLWGAGNGVINGDVQTSISFWGLGNWSGSDPSCGTIYQDGGALSSSATTKSYMYFDSTPLPSAMPTMRPTQPTSQPSSQPSRQPSVQPTSQPTQPTSQPSRQPSSQPNGRPTSQPSKQPLAQPTGQPSSQPTKQPSMQPSFQPTAQPVGQPSSKPSQQPSIQPSTQPSVQPSIKPRSQPSSQPTRQPSQQPSGSPSTQPSAQPSHQPSGLPSSQPSGQPSRQPSTQSLSRPSAQPSQQPSAQPSMQPTQRPTGQPSAQPSLQPSLRPSEQPSMQPSKEPSAQPTSRPSLQPSARPTVRPTIQPSVQPSGQPTSRPSQQPSTQPSKLPTCQPTTQPTSQPSIQPTSQPSVRPSTQPTRQPSVQPSVAPTAQPSAQHSNQPSSQPSQEPSGQPSAEPTGQPSVQPSAQPILQPSALPSTQPSSRPSSQPTSQPTSEPSAQPSAQPSSQPTEQPSTQPSAQPSAQPSSQPSSDPTSQPSLSPTTQPSMQPSTQPAAIPSVQPSTQPTTQPSGQPTNNPTAQPTDQPSTQPSGQPSSVPTAQPSTHPSLQPTSYPTLQPTRLPSSQPICQPSRQPSGLPTTRPSCQPSVQPTSRPTSRPLMLGNWETPQVETQTSRGLYSINDNVWNCGQQLLSPSVQCDIRNATTGVPLAQYTLPWKDIQDVVPSDLTDSVVLVGEHALSPESAASDVALCKVEYAQMSCSVMSFQETMFTASSYVPFPNKIVFIGTYRASTTVSVLDVSKNIVNSFVYRIPSSKVITLSQVQSPTRYVGSFTAGTSVSATNNVYSVVAGVVRTDTGKMTLMNVVPANGRFLNTAELVNAMALENSQPDSFIAGGLQLSEEDTGLHAYLLRVNVLFGAVLYGTRYRAMSNAGNSSNRVLQRRRVLSDSIVFNSVTRGMIRAGTTLYMIVDVNRSGQNGSDSKTSVTVMKTDMQTGFILLQVHLAAVRNASLSCTSITSTGLFITVACLVTYNASSVHSVLINTDLSLLFAKLPIGVTKQPSVILVEENLPFQRSSLPVITTKAQSETSRYNYSSVNGVQTFPPSLVPSPQPSSQPSSQPSRAPSGKPSSSPTSAPSVSPQPTSHPSSSTPTITYKPTVKPTQRPSVAPSKVPTVLPSLYPTPAPTSQPTVKPSPHPSAHPSRTPTIVPTRTITRKPTYTVTIKPSLRRSIAPTQMATTAVTDERKANRDLSQPELIVGYIMGVCLLLWCGYHAYNWNTARLKDVQKKWQKREFMMHGRKLLAEQPPHGLDLPDRLAVYKKLHGADFIEEMRAKSNNNLLVRKKSSVYGKQVPDTKSTYKKSAYLDSVLEDDTPMNAAPVSWYVDGAVVSGAYANSAPIQGMRIDQSAFFGFATGNVNPPNSVCSEDSGSLELSSVHSSELNEVEYSVHLNERIVDALYRGQYLQPSRSKENLMEEGGGDGDF